MQGFFSYATALLCVFMEQMDKHAAQKTEIKKKTDTEIKKKGNNEKRVPFSFARQSPPYRTITFILL